MTSLLLCAGALLVPDAAPLHRITERKTWKKTPALAVLLLVLLKGPVSLILSAMLVVGTIVWAIRTARQHARATDTFAHQHVLGVRDWGSARRERYAARVGGGG